MLGILGPGVHQLNMTAVDAMRFRMRLVCGKTDGGKQGELSDGMGVVEGWGKRVVGEDKARPCKGRMEKEGKRRKKGNSFELVEEQISLDSGKKYTKQGEIPL